MQCARCQHENPSESNFCLGCGSRLGLQCSACGNELPPGSRFCNKCGHAVSAQAESAQRFASPEANLGTPSHVSRSPSRGPVPRRPRGLAPPVGAAAR
jgi:predicted amidophosphoribosyltransferase